MIGSVKGSAIPKVQDVYIYAEVEMTKHANQKFFSWRIEYLWKVHFLCGLVYVCTSTST